MNPDECMAEVARLTAALDEAEQCEQKVRCLLAAERQMHEAHLFELDELIAENRRLRDEGLRLAGRCAMAEVERDLLRGASAYELAAARERFLDVLTVRQLARPCPCCESWPPLVDCECPIWCPNAKGSPPWG